VSGGTAGAPAAGPAGLTGRVALVTGGTRGIGLATVRALAAAGATVVLTGRDADRAAEAAGVVTAELAADQGPPVGPGGARGSVGAGPVTGIGLDAADFAAVTAAVQGVGAEHGRLDVLVANAGTLESAPLGMMRAEHVSQLLMVNVAGTVAAIQAASRLMSRKRSGAIVALSSVVASAGASGQSVYAASKAAVEALVRSAARELGPRGIRVNAVAPGVIDTDLTRALPEDLLRRQTGATPLGRLGTPDEVARVIRFLAGDEAAFVTGQVIGVDGGLVA
jgi:3-oxoacyl-[acyl-carrier protein] reductase